MHPSLHLARTIDEMRSCIDSDAERILHGRSAEATKTDNARLACIRILNSFEEKLRNRLSNKPHGTNEA